MEPRIDAPAQSAEATKSPADTDRSPESRRPASAERKGSVLPESFEGWYAEYRSTVYRYVRFRVASRDMAEDLTSDVFLKALRSFSRYDPDRAAPSTWLLRIARNTILDHFRRLRRRGSLHVSLDSAHDLVAEGPTQEERMMREERLQRLLNASQTLRAADSEILSLRYGAGLQNPEIAEHLGITANAVAVRLHRALTRLREAVENNGHLDAGPGPDTGSPEARGGTES